MATRAETVKELVLRLRSSGVPDFFEAARRVEQAGGVLRFAQVPSLTRPCGDVDSVQSEQGTVRFAIAFLGLIGPASPLTPEWTEAVLHGDEEGALQAFYDVFVHRAAAILFEAWKLHTVEGGFDLAGSDELSKRLRSFAGVDAWAEGDAAPVPPMAALGLADHRRGQGHAIDAASAEALLRRLMPRWPVRLEVAAGRFVLLTGSERSRLGASRCRLGDDLVYGDGREDTEGAVRIHIGPVDAATYESLMPGGTEYARASDFAAWVFSSRVEVELEVWVFADQVPTAKLGATRGARLGIDTRYAPSAGPILRVRVLLRREAAMARRTFALDP